MDQAFANTFSRREQSNEAAGMLAENFSNLRSRTSTLVGGVFQNNCNQLDNDSRAYSCQIVMLSALMRLLLRKLAGKRTRQE